MGKQKCCGTSIYNKKGSMIPSPNCAPECPEDIGCDFILPATCVSILPIENCLVAGENVQEALENLYNAFCEILPPSGYSYTVGVDAGDTCPSYLEDKLQSSCLEITVASTGTCKKINIDPKELNWVNNHLLEADGWMYKQGHQIPQYAIDCNKKVWFRGTCWNENYTLNSSSATPGAFDLSAQVDNLSPLMIRVLSSLRFIFYWGGTSRANQQWLSPIMRINTDGSTEIECGIYGLGDTTPTGDMYVYLDGFSLELN